MSNIELQVVASLLMVLVSCSTTSLVSTWMADCRHVNHLGM